MMHKENPDKFEGGNEDIGSNEGDSSSDEKGREPESSLEKSPLSEEENFLDNEEHRPSENFEFEHQYYAGGSIITEHDREKMLSGLEVLAKYLSELLPQELPNLILFPETSARPLAYLVKPLINKIYGNKQAEKPEYLFIKTMDRQAINVLKALPDLPPPTNEQRKELLDFSDLDASSDMPEELKDVFKKLRTKRAEQTETIVRAEQIKERIEESTKALNERAKEIVNRAKRQHFANINLLIIDDYARPQRETITMIRKAITINDPNVRVSAFVFISPSSGADAVKNTLVGSIDTRTGIGKESKGFDYRRPSTFSGNLRNEITGVVRGDSQNKYVEKQTTPDYQAQTDMRTELSKLGADFAQNYGE